MKKILFIFIVIFLIGCSKQLNVTGPWIEDEPYDPNMDKLIEDEPYDPNMDKLIEDEPYDPNMDKLIEDELYDPNMDKLIEDEPYDPNMDKLIEDEPYDPNMDKLIEDEPYDPNMDKLIEDEPYDPNMDKLIEDEPYDPNMDKLIIEDEVKPKKVIIGGWSCNSISETSICVEYIGSFWTEQQMKFACYTWIFSYEPCESGNIGGCNIWKNSFTEMIIWMYPYGWSPISADNVDSAKPSCDINPLGTWVNAK